MEELKARRRHGWRKLQRIKMDRIWINLKNVGSPFFKYLSVNFKMPFTRLENHSQLLCGRDFANGKTLALPVRR